MTSPRIALVTARAARDLDDDLAPLLAALHDLGADARAVDWDDASADWSCFDLAVLRSTWDYTGRLREFLAWAAQTATRTRLQNPLDVLCWSTDKHYLGVLAGRGIPIVPSLFVEPHEDAAQALDGFLDLHAEFDEFVVKPAIGAGSRDAQRHARDASDTALAHVRRLLGANRSVLLQPYLDRVDDHGETALIHFDGQFSHAIRKGPLLRRDDMPTRALFATEHITSRVPTPEERALAERTLAAIPFAQPLAYTRVDLIHDSDGSPCVLELELAEPSLFFAHAPGSALRFARVLLARAESADAG